MAALTLVVTRPQPDADLTAFRLKELGHRPLLAPALEFLPLSTPLPDASRFTGLVATSANALRALKLRGAIETWRHLHLWAVGDATAETARNFGFASITSAEGSATELAMVLRAQKTPLRLFYPAGRERADDLVAMVRAARHLVVATPVYQMRPLTELPTAVILALDGAAVDAVLFYSARSAESFLAMARPAVLNLADLVCLCLSEKSAAPLRRAGIGDVRVAAAPTEAALFDMLAPLSHAKIGS